MANEYTEVSLPLTNVADSGQNLVENIIMAIKMITEQAENNGKAQIDLWAENKGVEFIVCVRQITEEDRQSARDADERKE